MRALRQPHRDKRFAVPELREIADQAFTRAAGAPLIGDNSVRLLKDAGQNYPAWLEAIRNARRHIHFESYIIHEDDTGREFAEALIAIADPAARPALAEAWQALRRRM